MNTTIKQWDRRLERVMESMVRHCHPLTADELWKPPAPGSWSVVEVIQHLLLVNRSYFPVFSALEAENYRKPLLARSRMLAGLIGRMILKSVATDNPRKIQTFPVWEPILEQKLPPPAGIPEHYQLTEFRRQQTELRKWLRNHPTLIDANPIICSPASRKVFYPLQMALEIIVSHEERHLRQIVGIVGNLKSVGPQPLADR
ncbi:MAG: DinB family protein [Bacteroidota bacterium]